MSNIGKYVVIRTYAAGIHCGILKEKFLSGSRYVVVLDHSSRIWNWTEANTLDEVSLHGVGENSRISEPVNGKDIPDVIEILECTPKAEKNLRRNRWS